MFIRKTFTNNRKTGATYCSYRLIEAVRTPKGPRQRVVLHLGDLSSLDKVEMKKLARILEARLTGQPSLFASDKKLANIADDAIQNLDYRHTEAQSQDQKPKPEFTYVDVNSLGQGMSRSAGPEIIGHFAWNLLGFSDLLRGAGFSPFEIALSEITILGRLIQPRSELQTLHWINHQSALLELLSLERVGKNAIYEIADRLLSHKDEIEHHLREKEQSLFPRPKLVFLYDLTNTYLEGQALGNALAKRGHSKEKRNDRPLITLALLVDDQGFPIFSQVYRGNVGEPQTLFDVLARLETDYKEFTPAFRPTIVMDRGIATIDNIALIKNRNFHFVVVERRHTEKDYEQDFLDLSGFTDFKTTSGPIKLKKIAITDGTRILVQSEGRKAKERAINSLKEKRFLEDVEKLSRSVDKGKLIVPEKVGRRIGRILQRYPSMAAFYEITTEADTKGQRIKKILLNRKTEAKKKESIQGCYVIETSHKDMEAKEIWDLYTTLHKVEKGFQCLKSELGFRPVHHQLEGRTEAHLFISVLAYHLLNTIEALLEKAGDHRAWSTIREAMRTLTRGTVTFIDKKKTIHHIRTTGTLEPIHREILESLKIVSQFRRKHRKIQLSL